MQTLNKSLSIAAAILLWLPVGIGTAQADTSAAQRLQSQGSGDKAQLDKRFESVGTLLEKSSAAQQIEKSGDPQALDRRNRARAIYRDAQDAHKAGDNAKASKLLGKASAKMFEAVRLADPDKVTGEKAKRDYQTRIDSVKALLAAQKRIGTEKNNKDAARTAQDIERLMHESQQLANAEKYAEARAMADRAYLAARAAIGSMRGGDTLVRTLNFATKEEEYHYELDRNDTHQMLIGMLLGDKGGEISPAMRGFIDKAKNLRGEAEKTAGRGDHPAAIKLLEDSTAELVRAIRSAGIYIPG